MSGTFFDPNPPPKHVCQPPPVLGATQRGWRCDCGKAYVLMTEWDHGEDVTQWHRTPQFDDIPDITRGAG